MTLADPQARGYAQCKEKAHFEVRTVLDGGHAASCGCEPCRTIREVLGRRLRASSSPAMPEQGETWALDGHGN